MPLQQTCELQAIVLVGHGNRLHPLVDEAVMSKGLMPIANRPMISYVLQWLQAAGVEDILIVCPAPAVPAITTFLNSFYESSSTVSEPRKSGIKVVGLEGYLGTGDALKAVKDRIKKKDVLVVSGDVITNMSLAPMLDFHRTHAPTLTAFMTPLPKAEGVNTVPPRTANEVDYIMTDETSSVLLNLVNQADAGDDLSMRMSMLERFPNVLIRTDLQDNHIYIMQRWVIDYISSKCASGAVTATTSTQTGIGSPVLSNGSQTSGARDGEEDFLGGQTINFKLEILPLLLQSQYLGGLARREGIERFSQQALASRMTPFLREFPEYSNTVPSDPFSRPLTNSHGDFDASFRMSYAQTSSSVSSTPVKGLSKPSTPFSNASSAQPQPLQHHRHHHHRHPPQLGAAAHSLGSKTSLQTASSDSNRLSSQHLAMPSSSSTSLMHNWPLGGDPSRIQCLIYQPSPVEMTQEFSSPRSIGGVQQIPPYCYRANTIWMYSEANRQIIKGLSDQERVAETSEVNTRSGVGDSLIGDFARIDEKCSIKRSVVGAHCVIGKNVKLNKCILMDYVVIEDKVTLDGCIVCAHGKIGEKSNLKDCEIGAKAEVEKDTNAKGEKFETSGLEAIY